MILCREKWTTSCNLSLYLLLILEGKLSFCYGNCLCAALFWYIFSRIASCKITYALPSCGDRSPRMNPSEKKVNPGEGCERVKKKNCVCVCIHAHVLLRREGRGKERSGKKEIRIPRNMRNYGRKSWYYCQLKDASLAQNNLSCFKFHNSFVKVGSNKKTVTDSLSLNHCKWRESRSPILLSQRSWI